MKTCENNRRARTIPSDILLRVPIRASELDRFKFGKKWYYNVENIEESGQMLCLDVGCGGKPFPKADIVCDLCMKPVPDRRMSELVTHGKPFVLCDCHFLPFKDRAFGFTSCYYVIEHVDDPGDLFKELKRVSNHGYIQCPSWFSELLYGEKVHRWVVVKGDNKLLVKPTRHAESRLRLGVVFQRLYQSQKWRVFHAVLDELFQLFTVQYGY